MTEQDAAGSVVPRPMDPQFPAAFQPGYDPQQHGAVSASASEQQRVEHPMTVSFPPGPPPPPAQSPPAPPHAVMESPAVTPDVAWPEPAESGWAQDGPRREGGEPPRIAWWRRINPYLIVLALLGAGFMVGSVEAAKLLLVPNRGMQNYDEFQMFFYQFAMVGVPMLFVLGLATLTSVVAICAVRYRPRPPRR